MHLYDYFTALWLGLFTYVSAYVVAPAVNRYLKVPEIATAFLLGWWSAYIVFRFVIHD